MSHETRLKHQASETFLLSAVLSFSGGLQDAYTYCLRDKVFANAQTGNVVLMSQHFMKGDFMDGLQYMIPLIAFAVGVLIAEHINQIYKNSVRIHWRQIVLFIEIILLFAVGFIPNQHNMLASSIVSLTCAMQVETFKTVHGFGYASTMCIGNLKSGMESVYACVRDKDKNAFIRFYYYFGIIVTFSIGAGLGGIFSEILELKTIWLCCVILLICCLLIMRTHSIFHTKFKTYKKNESGNNSKNVSFKQDYNIDLDLNDSYSNNFSQNTNNNNNNNLEVRKSSIMDGEEYFSSNIQDKININTNSSEDTSVIPRTNDGDIHTSTNETIIQSNTSINNTTLTENITQNNITITQATIVE